MTVLLCRLFYQSDYIEFFYSLFSGIINSTSYIQFSMQICDTMREREELVMICYISECMRRVRNDLLQSECMRRVGNDLLHIRVYEKSS